ncbi:myosin, putative [Theileria equi strain WA]|uniref:Myosin, putative n=1 Tax=Theileria equi strain WA TaxID=1537102 RepID=L1LF05_THEEQ|nr:myosin, putative [Theileria equi strain WA]EKX73815.1 myosin, putative [Theileria equi strain WA]|eukprot:XP_004833267.1 myosin, putative [Theileria equi strain WA]
MMVEEGITIKLSQKGTNSGYAAGIGNATITVKRDEEPSGFYRYTHQDNDSGGGNKPFTLSKVWDDQSSPIPGIPPNGPESVISVSAYYWKHERPSHTPTRVLVVGVTKDKTTYYANVKNNGSNEWTILNSGSKPQLITGDIERTLDDLVCSNYGGVTIDLSKSTSMSGRASNGEPYCCRCIYHGDNDNQRRIAIQKLKVPVASTVEYYKHTIIGNHELARIRYYLTFPNNPTSTDTNNSKNRRRIKSSNFLFPMDGVKAVYAFHCNHNPELIYVEGGDKVKGWYHKPTSSGSSSNGDEQWGEVLTELKNVTPEKINDCNNWSKLAKELTCASEVTCPPLSPQPAVGLSGTGKADQEPVAVLPPSGKITNDHSRGTPGDSDGKSDTNQGGAPTVAEDPETPKESTQATQSHAETTSAGSAATFFGGWKLYNRYKGDSWVRQIWDFLLCLLIRVMDLASSNTDGGEDIPDDLTQLTHLHEASILHSLHCRFRTDKIYSLTGKILIAVNPFKTIHGLYSNEMMLKFMDNTQDKPPHVFSTASDAYQGLTLNEKSQTILISGESGAGKTESTKYVMKYLATAGAESLEKRSTVELKVLESNPLLETFGNASTIRNFNSSRYGKFIELQYVKTAPDRSRICGATIETYLLEKVRVTQQQQGERNYHIFHQLVAAFAESRVYEFPKSERHAHLEKWSFDLSYFEGNFRILPEDSTRDFDLEFFEDTIAAMQTLGMSFDDVNTVFSIIAAILHLSNIQFVVNRDCSEGAVVSNSVEDSATKVTELLNVDSATLLNVLLCRTIKTAHEFYSKPLRVEEASDVRDAIAKNIYSILFDYIVKVANQAIGYNPDAKLTCGILDIFGFECFTLNSFEQLCINFTNETLQNFFNNCVFKFEENLYTQEGVSWNPLDFPDNQDCVDLFKIKVNGLFPMVDEECQLPGGNDQALCNKICQRHANHKRFAKVRTDQTSFIIKHFAGEVKYKIDGFLEKNKDQLSDDAINFIISTKNKPIKAIFESYFGAIGPTKNKKKTISTQFCGQLDVLMSRISGTEPHFIRCIKPNQRCVPHEFERVSVNEQLRCGGMLQVVQVSRAGYPVRMKHLEFYNKFRYLQNGSGTDSQSLSQDDDVATKKAKALLDTLISKFIPYDPFENGSIAFGKSLIFFKNGPYDILFGALQEFRNNSATIIQAHVRCMIQRKLYSEWMFQIRTLQIWLRYKINRIKEMRRLRNEAILLIQSSFRMYVCRKKYTKLVSIVVRISSIFRSVQSQIDTKERHINTMATKLQASWKAYKHRSYYLELRTATIKAQLRWRSILARRQLRSLRMEAKSLGTMIKRVQDLQEELKEEKLKKTDAEAKLLQMGAKVAGLQQSLADMTAKYEKLLKERDSLQIQLSEVENANKRTLEDLKMIKEFVSREAMQTTSSPKRMYSKRPSGSIHRTDTYSSHDMRGEASPKAKVPTVDIILCGPAGCGKSRLVELALISKGDDANLTAHRTFEEKRMEETSLKLNIYEFGVEGSTSLKLAEIPGPHVNTEEARDLFQAAYLVAVCFDPSQEQSLLEGITIAKMLMSHVQLKQTSVAFIQNDFLLMEQGKSAFDANVAQKFAIDNELLYIRVDDLFTFMRKVAPFVESKKSLRSIISSKQSVEFQRQKSLRNANRSTLTMFYEKFRNFWSGVNSSSHSKLLQPTIVVDETTKLPPLSLKKVSHISKYTSAVTCLAIRPEEPTDPYILLAVGRRDGTINVFHCYRTTTELDVLAKGGFEEGAQYPLDESTKIVESFTLSLHTKAVTCMSFSKVNVNELVTSSVDCTIRAWNVMTGELIKVFNDSFPGLCILFHPLEPNLFICCNSSPTIRIVDYNKGTVIQKIRTKSELRCITFDDTRLNCIAGSEKGMLCIYESRANMHLKASTSKQISKGPVTCISFVPATSNDSVPCLIANVCSGNIAVINCIYDGSNGKICELTYRYTVNNSHVALPLRSCYSRFGGGWCVSGSEDRNILFFSLQDENMPYSINFHQSPVVTVEVNQLDTVIVSADAKGIVALWRRVTHAK